MNQQQPTQGQVPDDRLNQIMQEVRSLRDENQRLRGNVDLLAQQRGQPQPQQPSPFAPEVDKAIEQKFQALLQPFVNDVRNQTGYMHDQLDYVRFQQQYAAKPQYSDFLPKVEDMRRQAQNEGKWLSREDALRLAYFEETGKKATPQNAQQQAPKGPVFDSYLQQYVDESGKIVPPPNVDIAQAPNNQPPQQPQQQAQPQQYQQPQAFNQPQPIAQPPYQGQMQPQPQPYQQQAYNQAPQLPQQDVNQFRQAPAAPAQGQHLAVDITSNDQALDLWANKYGDVPL